MKSLVSTLRPTLVMMALLTVLLGGAYPALTTLILQLGFKSQAQGSLVNDDKGQPIGSKLIGQNFSKPGYFWGRLSATSPNPYNAANSSGSNYGVNNPTLLTTAKGRIDALMAADPGNKLPIPVDLVTASASGLDPDITPAAAYYQTHRVAMARHLSEDAVRVLIANSTRDRSFGLLGEPRVNVLELNLRLDGKLK